MQDDQVTEVEIWPKETGITDLPEDLSRLTLESMAQLRAEWASRRRELEGTEALKTFTEQLHREWAIETGQIENLYDIERGVTQTLIEQGFQAAILEHGSTNRPPEEVLALITDQKDALEGLFDFVKQDRPLSTSYIKELHAAMTRSQETTEAFDPSGNLIEVPLHRGEWKTLPNYPMRGGKRFLYCPPEQTSSEMDRLVSLHLEHHSDRVAPEAEAAWLHHRFTQIHPFQDGNGRVARALASLVLIRADMFPLVVPRDEKNTYIDSLERADQGDLRPLTLLIARRQDREFRRAETAVAKLAPPSASPREAAEALARALHHNEKSRQVRWEQLRMALGTQIFTRMSSELERAFKTIREVVPGFGMTGGIVPQFPKEGLLLFGHQLFPPTDFTWDQFFYRSTWLFTSPFQWHLDLLVGHPPNDLEDRIGAGVFVTTQHASPQMVLEPLWLQGRSAGDLDNPELEQWSKEAVSRTLDFIRKNL